MAAVSMNLTSNPDISGVVVSGNGINGLQVDSGTVEGDLVWDNPESSIGWTTTLPFQRCQFVD